MRISDWSSDVCSSDLAGSAGDIGTDIGGTMSFFKAAARLAGVAGWLLGWRPEEFWRATPAELEGVLRAARGQEDEARAGMDRGGLVQVRDGKIGSASCREGECLSV